MMYFRAVTDAMKVESIKVRKTKKLLTLFLAISLSAILTGVGVAPVQTVPPSAAMPGVGGDFVQAAAALAPAPYNTVMATRNLCYVAYDVHDVRGVMIHSTGVNTPWLRSYVAPDDGIVGGGPNNRGWNTPTPAGRLVAVHAFVGRDEAGTIRAYQTLPWEIGGWHSGSADPDSEASRNANANRNGYIGIEMCEDNLTGFDHLNDVYDKTVELTAYLCVRYKIQPEYPYIIGHAEGHRAGIASNHADPDHWFRRHGRTMDDFRRDVRERVGHLLNVPAEPMRVSITADGTAGDYELLSVAGRAYMELNEAIGLLKADPAWIKAPDVWRYADGAITLDSLSLLGNKIYVDIYRADGRSYVDLEQFAEALDSSFTQDAEGIRRITIGRRLVVSPSRLVVSNNTAVGYNDALSPRLTYNYFTIEGRRYFKLRDIAHILSITPDRFEIATDAFSGLNILLPGWQYTPNRSEHRTRMLRGDSFAIPAEDNMRIAGAIISVPAYRIDGVIYHSIDDIRSLISSAVAAMPPIEPTQAAPTISLTPQTVIINGESVTFEVFSRDDSNYFRLRDLAYSLNGTNKRFELGWDSVTGSVTLTSGNPYMPDGSEMKSAGGAVGDVTPNTGLTILIDGAPETIAAYLVDGNNFVKLRDLMKLLDIEVAWDAASGTIGLNTSSPYVD